MQRFPFDAQRLEAVFEVLGFDEDEVRLEVESDGAMELAGMGRVPQWTVTGISVSSDRSPSQGAGRVSALLLRVDVQRQSWFARRLVVAPLVAIVLLSFSVFWMDRASLGDRVSVSCIGILTAVAYQLVTSEQVPRIAYVTVMHGFLNISFLTNVCDGRHQPGNRPARPAGKERPGRSHRSHLPMGVHARVFQPHLRDARGGAPGVLE